MNKLVIPPSPNWFASNILACASDNTILYGSRNEIVVIKPAPPEEPADIQVLSGIHSTRVTFVSLNTNWGNPNKWAVSVAEDNVVQLLDIATCKPKISHVGHKTHPSKLIGAVFCGEDRVVSVSEQGIIILWKLSTNSLTPIHTMKGMHVKVSILSSCPHAPWIVAFGLKRGGIIIMDLKKMGKVLFKIHAHDDEVISLSWCPTPYNIFPKNVRKITIVKQASSEANPSKIKESAHDNLGTNAESIESSATKEESPVTHQICSPDPQLIENEALGLRNHQSSADEITETNGAIVTIVEVHKEEECVKESTGTSDGRKDIQAQTENIETIRDLTNCHYLVQVLQHTNDDERSKLDMSATPANSPRAGNIKIKNISDVTLREKVEDHFLEDSSTISKLVAPLSEESIAIDSADNSLLQKDPIINSRADEITETNGTIVTIVEVHKEEECGKESTGTSNGRKDVQAQTENIETISDLKNCHYLVQVLQRTNDNKSSKLDMSAKPVHSPRADNIKIKNISDVLLQEKVEDDFLEDSSTITKLVAPLSEESIAIDSADNSLLQKRPEDQLSTEIKYRTVGTWVTPMSLSINEERTVIDPAGNSSMQASPIEVASENSPRASNIKIKNISDVILQEEVEDPFLEDSSTISKRVAPLSEESIEIDSADNSAPEDQLSTEIKYCTVGTCVTPRSLSINEESTIIDPAGNSSMQEPIEAVTDIDLSELTTPKQEFLLASYARGSRSIKIWRAGSNGLLQTEVFAPNQPYPKRSNKNHHDKAWLCVCWVTPTQLLSSTSKGQLLLWELNELKESASGKRNYHYRVIHADHSKHVFCIAAPVRNYPSVDAGGGGDMGELNAWTIGNDRFILNTSLGTGFSNLVTYSTIGGAVTCLVPSSITPSRIACGFSDGNNKIWDLSQAHMQRVILNPILEKHTIKVTSFAWHPTKEDCLAYGTVDGYIGLIDASSLSKNATQLVQSSAAAVCHLQWGPLDSDTLGLYTVAKGKLLVYNVKKPLHEPTAIEFDVDYNLTSFSWKPDNSIIAIATKNFELLLYSNKFKLLNTFLLQCKIVRCLAWHPSDTAEENWLAISSNQVIVYDCTEKNTEGSSKYDKCAIAIFTQHKGNVQCLSWSPHQSGILASAGDDGSALIWNVKSQTLLHACHCYSDVLSSVVWSPFDAEYLITGGKACTIRIWKLSENPPVLRPEKPSANPALRMNEENDDTPDSIVTKTESKPRRTTKQFLNGIARIHNVNNHSELLQNCLRLFSLRSMSSEEISSYKDELDKESEFNVMNLFGDKDGIVKILGLERENHLNRTTPLSLESVSLWEGNIDETIKNAIKCGSLNPWLIGIAPMVSHSLWQEACESYAKQLLDSANNKPVEASFYYLACHKVEEAIEALCSGSYYREALILAKNRLSDSDPIINNVIELWAKYAASVGCYEVAAQCYIALDKLEEATKVLFRRTDIPTLEFCVTLAKEIGNEDMLHATLFRLNSFKSESSNEVEDPVTPLPTKSEVEPSPISCDIEIVDVAVNKTDNGEEIASDNTIVA